MQEGDLVQIKDVFRAGPINPDGTRSLVSVNDPDFVLGVIDPNGKLHSIDHFTEVKEESRSNIVARILNSHDAAFKVNFTKKDGELRDLVGVYQTTDQDGRNNVLDLDIGQLRKVDNRTVHYIIMDNVKYVCS